MQYQLVTMVTYKIFDLLILWYDMQKHTVVQYKLPFLTIFTYTVLYRSRDLLKPTE